MDRIKFAAAMLAIIGLASCGGGGGDSTPAGTATVQNNASVQRGALRSASTVRTLSTAAIDDAARSSGLLLLSGPAKCDVTLVSVDYQTIGARANEVTNATGVLLLPSGTTCPAGPLPLLAYARGTDIFKARSLASANPVDPETLSLAAIFAAQGYAVVATDYLGFAGSQYSFHPYLHADSEASTVIDSIRAARAAATGRGVVLSGKVMVAGYSEGGHASMATQRAIERDNPVEFNLVAGGHMSGPYNLSQSIVSEASLPIVNGQFFVPFFITAWQKVYGNIYSTPTQVFREPFATGIESLFPGPFTFTTAIQNGKLPADTNYLPVLFQPAFLQDIQTNPNSPTVIDARRNDLLGWNPRARMALCGGSQDPTVNYSINTRQAQADFAARSITVQAIDVDPIIQSAADLANKPVDLAAYHGTLVPPLCMTALRDQLFNPLR
ncbi:alpha/beta hydrolase family protein [Noviherbaspirillum massiliense]|uniref:alpha/beta hydrolase family protein n=1 Tax=Noviherbaspirillum massiliense TaxID=1465823 RepID=UPI00030D2424|nr:lipase family protein [Noviherbaspirillum massiliense]